jgi:hypothetical protein
VSDKQWGLFETTKGRARYVSHVIPLEDLKEHEESLICWCNPRSDVFSEHKVLYVHHALDKREHDEPDHDDERCAYCIAYSTKR